MNRLLVRMSGMIRKVEELIPKPLSPVASNRLLPTFPRLAPKSPSKLLLAAPTGDDTELLGKN